MDTIIRNDPRNKDSRTIGPWGLGLIYTIAHRVLVLYFPCGKFKEIKEMRFCLIVASYCENELIQLQESPYSSVGP